MGYERRASGREAIFTPSPDGENSFTIARNMVAVALPNQQVGRDGC